MYDALKLLGFNPLHSGYKLKSRDAVCGYLFGGEPLDDALAVLDGYDAAMDEPFMLIYEEAGVCMCIYSTHLAFLFR